MSNRPRGRKKHLVDGKVAKIVKKEELEIEQVGESSGLVKRLIRRFKKESKDVENG